MTGSWQCWRDIYESAGGRVCAFNDCVALSTLAHFSLFFHLWHIARSCCRCVVSLNLFTLTTAICGPVACSRGREGGWWWRQTPADNSWLCLMSNWHYNGCPHSRWNSPPVSAVSALNLLAASPEGTIGMFLHRLPHSLWSVLNRKLCSHFAQLFLGLLGGGGLLWLYEVIAIIVAHTPQTWINTITMQHLVWRRFSGPFPSLSCPSHAKNKCNLLLPICQKRKAKKGKEKREIAQSQCMCYKFQEKQKMISQKNNIWN